MAPTISLVLGVVDDEDCPEPDRRSFQTARPSLTTISTKHEDQTTYDGVITRICDFKYGFVKSDQFPNIFFHFTELSDDAKAFIEAGVKVTFRVKPNGTDVDDNPRMKAVKIQVISEATENEYMNMEGEVVGDMQDNGGAFCFIINGETTYLFHVTNMVTDDASKAIENEPRAGHKVVFDAIWNHKYNPPKPFATRVRIVPGQAALASPRGDESGSGAKTWRRGNQLELDDEETESIFSRNSSPCVTTDEQSEKMARLSSRGAERSAFLRSTFSGTSNISSPRRHRCIGENRDISPSNAASASAGTESPRALALRSSAPLKRWTRTTKTSDDATIPRTSIADNSPRLNGGQLPTSTPCKFGTKCTRKECWFKHPEGRGMDEDSNKRYPGGATPSAGGGTPCGSTPRSKPTYKSSYTPRESIDDGTPSMGKASLNLLVQDIIKSGKKGYVSIRNTLQKSEYLGRDLTREEKNSVGDILQELDAAGNQKQPTRPRLVGSSGANKKDKYLQQMSSPRKSWRETASGRPPMSMERASFTVGDRPRVSLTDLCRDPALHTRLSSGSLRVPCS